MKFLIATLLLSSFKVQALPFYNLNTNWQHQGQLVAPASVPITHFKNVIHLDCQKYQAELKNFQMQGHTLSSEHYNELKYMPLAFSMRPSFEVFYSIENQIQATDENIKFAKTVSVSERLQFKFNQQAITSSEMQKTAENEVELVRAPEFAQMNYWLKFKSRDLFCDFINQNLKIETAETLYVQLANSAVADIYQAIEDLSKEKISDKIKAALLGYRSADLFKKASEQIDQSFLNLIYAFSLLENNQVSFKKNLDLVEQNNIFIKANFYEN